MRIGNFYKIPVPGDKFCHLTRKIVIQKPNYACSPVFLCVFAPLRDTFLLCYLSNIFSRQDAKAPSLTPYPRPFLFLASLRLCGIRFFYVIFQNFSPAKAQRRKVLTPTTTLSLLCVFASLREFFFNRPGYYFSPANWRRYFNSG